MFGCPVREFVGSTEAGVVGSRLRVGDQLPSWQPLPGISVTRRDDGRMHVRSPFIFNRDDEMSDDLIELDDAGGFRLLGRADRIAKIEGVRISLAEFDARLAKLPGVAQAAVVVLGGDTPYLGGVVVLDAAGRRNLLPSAHSAWGVACGTSFPPALAAAALPRRWRFVRELADRPPRQSQRAGSRGPVQLPTRAVETPLPAASAASKIEPDVLGLPADGRRRRTRLAHHTISHRLTVIFPACPSFPASAWSTGPCASPAAIWDFSKTVRLACRSSSDGFSSRIAT